MNISKSAAHDIAKQVLANNKKEVDELEDLLTSRVSEEWLKTVPSEVVELHKSTNKGYLEKTHSIRLCGNGFNYQYVGISNSLPYSSTINLSPDETTAKELLKLYNQHQESLSKYKKLLKNVESTLVSLRTYKRISEHFPKAIPFLPKVENTEVAINLEDLISQIL